MNAANIQYTNNRRSITNFSESDKIQIPFVKSREHQQTQKHTILTLIQQYNLLLFVSLLKKEVISTS